MKRKIQTTQNRHPVDLGSFQPGSVIIFFDKNTNEPPDETGCNQIGVVLGGNTILFVRKRKIIEKDINDLNILKATGFHYKDQAFGSKVHRYFEVNKTNHHLFTLGLTMLKSEGRRFFDFPTIMPNLITWTSSAAYDAAWNALVQKLLLADLICTFNEKSLLSRLIASLDGGSWSHSAVYVGDGQICEAMSEGLLRRPIEVHRNKHTHFGIYRVFDITPQQQAAMVTEAKRHLGKGYNYIGAIRVGLKLLFRVKLDPKKPGHKTPNDLIYTGAYYLVDYL